MAFAYAQIGAGSGAAGARQSNDTIGDMTVEFYSFTQLATDTGGTITTQMGRPVAAFATATTSTANDVGVNVSGQTAVVATTATGGPTAGFVMVLGFQR